MIGKIGSHNNWTELLEKENFQKQMIDLLLLIDEIQWKREKEIHWLQNREDFWFILWLLTKSFELIYDRIYNLSKYKQVT